MNDDTQLLRDYVEESSEPAFRALVERHVGLVYATARRVAAGDSHLAQDVTQLVFTDLARKASSLPAGVVLAGWLHCHTSFTAAKVVRTESRRRNRERTAMEMNVLNESPVGDAQWRQLAPVLDDALNSLAPADRDAIALRFLEQRDLRSIGAALGTNEDAAQKRIARALEKLRGYLTKRGLTFSAALLVTTLEAGAAPASVPSRLVATVSGTALKTVSSSSLVYLLKTMITSKYTVGIAALAVLTGVATVLVGQNQTAGNSAKTSASPAAATAETKTAVPPATASGSQKKTVVMTQGNPPANPASGSSFSSSGSVRVKNGVVTVTTNENGVVKTETHPVPADGRIVSSNGNSGFHYPVGEPAPGTPNSGSAGTTVIDAEGNVKTEQTDFAPDADGNVHAIAKVSSPSSSTDPAPAAK